MSDTKPHEPIFDVDQIGRLMEMMERHSINVVDVRSGDARLRIRRGFRPAEMAVAPAIMPASYASAPPAPTSPEPPPAAPAPSAPAAANEDGPHIAYVKSPMVGTLYLRPKPDAEPYVKVGDRVGPETTVCIIEAMKTFNEIPAGVSGVITAILAKNEEPVDYDRPLFRIDTSK